MNSTKYFVLNRLSLAEAAQREGYEVMLASPDDDARSGKQIEKRGIRLYRWPLARRGLRPFSTLYSLYKLYRIIRETKPDAVHAITIKPVILSGLLCRVLGVPVVALVPGRGIAFERSHLRQLARILYRHALGHRDTQVCFQNREDRDLFLAEELVTPESAILILGSGVNTARFSYKPYRRERGKRVVTLAARMLKEKGILEYIQAAGWVQRHNDLVEFRLAGAPDPGNPSSIDEAIIRTLCREAQVTYLGHVDDMPELLGETDIFCLPTYYPEGIPMALLQAASMGKALIATDVPGCREVVIDGNTGILIPPRDPSALAYAIKRLLVYPHLCRSLTTNCRKRLEQRFTEQIVHEQTLALYRDIVR